MAARIAPRAEDREHAAGEIGGGEGTAVGVGGGDLVERDQREDEHRRLLGDRRVALGGAGEGDRVVAACIGKVEAVFVGEERFEGGDRHARGRRLGEADIHVRPGRHAAQHAEHDRVEDLRMGEADVGVAERELGVRPGGLARPRGDDQVGRAEHHEEGEHREDNQEEHATALPADHRRRDMLRRSTAGSRGRWSGWCVHRSRLTFTGSRLPTATASIHRRANHRPANHRHHNHRPETDPVTSNRPRSPRAPPSAPPFRPSRGGSAAGAGPRQQCRRHRCRW